ncbi:hypothetical protein BAU67_001805 [Escherichia coli]|nr:hypothetical protein [Escherichia coli]EMB7054249.1 hypothetical protein [Escherichia coli]
MITRKLHVIDDHDITKLAAGSLVKVIAIRKDCVKSTIDSGDILKIEGDIKEEKFNISSVWASNPFSFEKYWEVEYLMAENDHSFIFKVQPSCVITRRSFE